LKEPWPHPIGASNVPEALRESLDAAENRVRAKYHARINAAWVRDDMREHKRLQAELEAELDRVRKGIVEPQMEMPWE
jgi:hypothetical protein